MIMGNIGFGAVPLPLEGILYEGEDNVLHFNCGRNVTYAVAASVLANAAEQLNSAIIWEDERFTKPLVIEPSTSTEDIISVISDNAGIYKPAEKHEAELIRKHHDLDVKCVTSDLLIHLIENHGRGMQKTN